jgi:hypothetical protein
MGISSGCGGIAIFALPSAGNPHPQLPQNLKLGGLVKPQWGHEGWISCPHSPQYFMPSGFSNWQFWHFMGGPQSSFMRVLKK